MSSGPLFSALSRVAINGVGHLYGRIRRLYDVQQAYEGHEKRINVTVKTAYTDIVKVFGNRGLVTERVSQFLDELATSGLIDQNAIAAVSEIGTRGLVLHSAESMQTISQRILTRRPFLRRNSTRQSKECCAPAFPT